jgi:hypothetical protein
MFNAKISLIIFGLEVIVARPLKVERIFGLITALKQSVIMA